VDPREPREHRDDSRDKSVSAISTEELVNDV
jgi:hypothetical protein